MAWGSHDRYLLPATLEDVGTARLRLARRRPPGRPNPGRGPVRDGAGAGVLQQPPLRSSRPAPAPRRSAGAGGLALLLIVLAGVGLPVLVTLWTGSFRIPHNDDWSYIKTAIRFHEAGVIELQGWVAAGLVGQVVMSAPVTALFGASPTVLNATTAAWGVVGLVVAYRLLLLVLPVTQAALATAVLAAFPGFALLTTSFMTDVPALALTVISLYLGAVALSSARPGLLLTASCAVGFLAMTVREHCLAAPAAVLLVHLWSALGGHSSLRSRLGDRRVWSIVMGGTVLLVLTGIYLKWRYGLSGAWPQDPAWSPGRGALVLARGFAFLGLAALPALAVRAAALPRRALLTGIPLTAAFIAVTLVRPQNASLLPGNYLTLTGAYKGVEPLGRDSPLFAVELWLLLQLVVLAAAYLLFSVLADRRPPGTATIQTQQWALRILLVFAGLYTLVMAGLALVGWPLFDRYLLPLMVPVLAQVLHRVDALAARRLTVTAVPCLVVLAGTSLTLLLNSSVYDAVRWATAAQHVATSGLSPEQVTSGLEWTGMSSGSVALPELLYGQESLHKVGWFTAMFPDRQDCLVVNAVESTDTRLQEIARQPYRRYLVAGSAELFVYRHRSC